MPTDDREVPLHTEDDDERDALVAHGSPETVYRRLDEDLSAGADHVGIQVLTGEHDASLMPAFRALATHRPSS
ncbi:hypothetical protein JCM12141A_38150 [Mycolicibacterium hodleri]